MNSSTATQTRSSQAEAVAVKAGLCVNCNHAASCALLAAGGPVWYCEEYDGHEAVASRPTAAPKAVVASPAKGICANCEDNSTCRLTVAAAGAIYCEEYR